MLSNVLFQQIHLDLQSEFGYGTQFREKMSQLPFAATVTEFAGNHCDSDNFLSEGCNIKFEVQLVKRCRGLSNLQGV